MNICVFCASSNEAHPKYKEEAAKLGHFIGAGSHTLVYGGATGGLMDQVASQAAKQEGEIVGVIPDLIIEKGRKSDLPTQMFQVADMSERKEMMKEYADVFVVLPGGFGTCDELFDVIASGMVGYHDKPIILVNSFDYYHGLIEQFTAMQQAGMGKALDHSVLQICSSVDHCIELLKSLDQ